MASRSGQREQRASRKVETDEAEDDLTKVEYETSEGVEVIPTFDGIGLREDLLRGIYAYGLSSYNVICMLKFEN
jgi:ATP-dependent RNA helicase